MIEQTVSSFSQTKTEEIENIIEQHLREGWLVKFTNITFFQLGGTGIIIFERASNNLTTDVSDTEGEKE